MAVLRVGQWAIARRILRTAPVRVKRALDMATQQEAQYFRRMVVRGITSQSPGGRTFAPLAESTLKARRLKRFRGTKALMVRGDLRNSVVVQRTGFGAAFVGVLKSGRAKNGQSMANIAEVHEFGSNPIVIRITPKMRAFLHILNRETGGRDRRGRFTTARSSFAQASKGFVVIRVRARPFIRPIAEEHFKPGDVRRRFLARVGVILNGDFGQMGIAIPR